MLKHTGSSCDSSRVSAAGNPLFAEPLESRRLLATVIWDGGPTGTGTDFNTAANWVGDVRPGVNDDAVIGIGTNTISITAATTVNSIQSARPMQISGNALVQTAGANQLSASLTFVTGEIRGGTWTFTGITSVLNATNSPLLRDTTINGEVRPVTPENLLRLSGSVYVQTLRLRESTHLSLETAAIFNGNILVDVRTTAGATIQSLNGCLGHDSSIDVVPGSIGFLNIDGYAYLLNEGTIRNAVPGFVIGVFTTSFYNYADIFISNGASFVYTPSNTSSRFQNSGLIQVRSAGVLRVATDLLNPGIVDVINGTLDVGGTVQGANLIDPAHVTLVNSVLMLEGTVNNQNNDLNFDSIGADIVFSGATVVGGTMNWSDARAPHFRWRYSNLQIPTTLRDVRVLRSVTIAGTLDYLALEGGSTIVGILSVQAAPLAFGPGFLLDFRVLFHVGDTTVFLIAGANLTISPLGSIEVDTVPNRSLEIRGPFTNYGLIKLSGLQSYLRLSGERIDNFGTIQCGSTCYLTIDPPITYNNGRIEGLSGSHIIIDTDWDSPGVVSLQNTDFKLSHTNALLRTSKLGLNRFERTGGRFVLGYMIDNTDQTLVLTPSLGIVIFENLEIRGGIVSRPPGGLIEVSGELRLRDVSVLEPLNFDIGDTLYLGGSTRVSLIQMHARSALTALENTYVLRDPVQLVGTPDGSVAITIPRIGASGAIVAMPEFGGNATLNSNTTTITNDGLLDLRTASIFCRFINNGTFRWTSSQQTTIAYSFANNGTLNIGGVSIVFLVPPTNTGVWSIHDRALLDIRGDGWRNDGMLDVDTSTVLIAGVSSNNIMHNYGTIATNRTSTFRLTVGVLVNEATGILQLEIGGAGPGQSSRLTTDGAILNGTLRLRYVSGFTPAIISSYTFLTTPAGRPLTVNFSTLDLPAPAVDGKNFIRAEGTNLKLFVSSAADFNSDGIVDQSDYQSFYNAFAAGGTGADFNGDGVIDMFDYLDFVRIYARR